MNNDDTRSERDLLERCKRASLRQLALRAAWDLGALVRRVEHEAPAEHRRLRDAVEVLQQLAHGLSARRPSQRASRSMAAIEAVGEAPKPGSPRQGELF